MRSRGVDNVGVHLADQGRLTVKKELCKPERDNHKSSMYRNCHSRDKKQGTNC